MVTKRFLFMQFEERTTSSICNFYCMDRTVSGLAVAVRPRIVGLLFLYLIILSTISPSARKDVLKLWLSSERECASSMQVKLASGKSSRL